MNTSMIYLVTIIIMFVVYLLRKKISFMTYQLFVATVYLISLSLVPVLDILLVIYLVFAILPNIKKFKIMGFVETIFIAYFGLNLVLSCFLNGITSAISIFIIRYIGIIFFIYFYKNMIFENTNNNSHKNDKESLSEKCSEDTFINQVKTKSIIRKFAICELILTIIAIAISGGGRLMLNYQCTVGNISIVGILICGYYLYISNNKSTAPAFLYSIFFTLISIFSGTRGYLIICIVLLGIYILMYGNRAIKCIVFTLFLLIIIVNYSSLFEKFMETTRLSESTGRRDSENLLVWYYMPEHPLNMFIGLGFGKSVSSLDNVSMLISRVSNSSYTTYILHRVNAFHNLYATTYYSAGILGIIIILSVFNRIIKCIKKFIVDNKFKIICISFILLYMFLLWFRWSATSGILEFATLSYVLMNAKKFSDSQKQS